MASLSLSIIALICALYNTCCNATPAAFPCCPGSQHVVALMSKHVDTFTADQDESTVCKNAETLVRQVQDGLYSTGQRCQNDGGTQLVEQIHHQLTRREVLKMEISNDDICSYNLGFARAMFDLAARVAAHAGKGSEWRTLMSEFGAQKDTIENIGYTLKLDVAQVQFTYPSRNGDSAHQNVPNPSAVIANPGTHSSLSIGQQSSATASDTAAAVDDEDI